MSPGPCQCATLITGYIYFNIVALGSQLCFYNSFQNSLFVYWCFNIPFNNFSVILRRYLLVAVGTQAHFQGAASSKHYGADTEYSIPLSHIILKLSTPVLPLSIIPERQTGGEKSINFSVLGMTRPGFKLQSPMCKSDALPLGHRCSLSK